MNDFGCIDYKKPIVRENDMRTSTYCGHKHMTDKMASQKLNVKFKNIQSYKMDPILEKMRISEYAEKYVHKYSDPHKLENPSLGPKVEFIKDFEDRRLRFIMRTQVPQRSVSHQDYRWQKQLLSDAPSPIIMLEPLKASRIIINSSNPCAAKLLDPAATTSKLDFVRRTPQELMNSMAVDDYITFWNWKEKNIPAKCYSKICKGIADKDRPKSFSEFPSQVRSVPHTGMTTEVRDNYKTPITRTINVDLNHIRNCLEYVPMLETSKRSEYQIYGSGDCTHKYV